MITVARLAEHPRLVSQVGELRWREWAGEEDASPEGWTRTTARENGSHRLPMTLVAIDDSGSAGVHPVEVPVSTQEGCRGPRNPRTVSIVSTSAAVLSSRYRTTRAKRRAMPPG